MKSSEAVRFAMQYDIEYLEVSAKNNENISDIFRKIVNNIRPFDMNEVKSI